MIRLRKYISLVGIFVLGALSTQAQENLFDLDHSKQFARYLMQSGQYRLASSEWQRVHFLDPSDSHVKLNLIQSYRLSGQFDSVLKNIDTWFGEQIPAPFAREGIKAGLSGHLYADTYPILRRASGLAEGEDHYYQLGLSLLQWDGSGENLTEPAISYYHGYEDLKNIHQRARQMKLKKPWVATGLSALVPGLGKVYTGDWKNAILTLLFVGGNVLQSYRGFSKFGVQNPYGWIFGTLAVGFYSANLFGSWKSAKDYNTRQIEMIHYETENTLFSRF